MAILGVLLVFAGSQLALTVIDMQERKDLFVVADDVGYNPGLKPCSGIPGGDRSRVCAKVRQAKCLNPIEQDSIGWLRVTRCGFKTCLTRLL